jgi:hypothetical protein
MQKVDQAVQVLQAILDGRARQTPPALFKQQVHSLHVYATREGSGVEM